VKGYLDQFCLFDVHIDFIAKCRSSSGNKLIFNDLTAYFVCVCQNDVTTSDVRALLLIIRFVS